MDHKAYLLAPCALPQKSGSKCKAYLLTPALFRFFHNALENDQMAGLMIVVRLRV